MEWCARAGSSLLAASLAEKAWRNARKALMDKLGTAINSEAELNKKASEIFDSMDADKNGSIDEAELKQAFHEAGVELKTKEVKAMMDEADQDGCALTAATHRLPRPAGCAPALLRRASRNRRPSAP